MTHITIEREALQTVLDTLEENHHLIEQCERSEYLALYDRQITVIKQALAAPVQPVSQAIIHAITEYGDARADQDANNAPTTSHERLADCIRLIRAAQGSAPPTQPAPVQPVQGQVLGFDVVLNESLPPNTMKFVQPATTVQEPVYQIRYYDNSTAWHDANLAAYLERPEKDRRILYTTPPAAQPAVHEGWRLVPVEPTDEMLAAADEGDREYTIRNFGDVQTVMQGPYDHYVAMLAAAPEKGN
jgi:hypothetical protein